MDTFATLALATDQALEVLLDRKPDKKTDPLFTVDMIKQIIGQSTYLSTVIIIFHFLGSQIFGFDGSGDSTLQKHQATIIQTLVFNVFVFDIGLAQPGLPGGAFGASPQGPGKEVVAGAGLTSYLPSWDHVCKYCLTGGTG